jgi:hypothetical protein
MKLRFPHGVMSAYSEATLRLRFTDAAGRSWQRYLDGTLQRIPDGYARTMYALPTSEEGHARPKPKRFYQPPG